MRDRKTNRLRLVCLTLLCLAAAPATRPGRLCPPDLDAAIDAIRTRRNVPAVGLIASDGGKLVARATWGDANLGDAWHIGSDTKAMTATLAARMIEAKAVTAAGKPLDWSSTFAECCPDLAAKVDAGYGPLTLEQLFSHTAGLADPPPGVSLPLMRKIDADATLTPRARRAAALAEVLEKPPAAAPGERFAYSNLGYVIAGHMLEVVAGDDWESLMKAHVFGPLGMTSAGFGPPPRLPGHDAVGRPVRSDNPPTLGPAGTVHVSLDDWLKFADVHAGRGPKDFLTPATLAKLHAPVRNRYALGWGIVTDQDGSTALVHDGSNTFWLARAIVRPSDGRVLLIAMNNADDRACDAVTAAAVEALFRPTTRPASRPSP